MQCPAQKTKFVVNAKIMAALSLDNEFMEYWQKLSVVQKESLLEVAKIYVAPAANGRISIEQYNREIDEALAQVEKGEVYTQEEVERMSKNW